MGKTRAKDPGQPVLDIVDNIGFTRASQRIQHKAPA